VELREAERITGDGEVGVALLADIEQLAVVEVRAAPGDVAPPLHVHASHAECFYVVDGELTVRLEDRELRAGAGTWVQVPPEVVHTFSVTGGSPAHFLDFHAPSCGFGDFVRGLHAASSEDELRTVRAAFDQQPAPEYATGDPGLVTVCRIGGADGDTIGESNPEHRSTLVVESDELTVTEFLRRPGATGPPPHVHHGHADAFLVVGGELTFTLGTDSFSGPVGTFFLAPPDVVHTFANDGTVPAHFFNFHMPASGFGDYMRGRKPDFDQHVVPQDSGVDPATAVVTRLSR
jgi:mannose-6-phosphate isomerase-like protein (cupin superfamily)